MEAIEKLRSFDFRILLTFHSAIRHCSTDIKGVFVILTGTHMRERVYCILAGTHGGVYFFGWDAFERGVFVVLGCRVSLILAEMLH